MSDSKITIHSPNGRVVGYFINPTITMTHEHDYTISGNFYTSNGDRPSKIDFNPEALPYNADISDLKKCQHNKIDHVFVQRSRQPIIMTGFCKQS